MLQQHNGFFRTRLGTEARFVADLGNVPCPLVFEINGKLENLTRGFRFNVNGRPHGYDVAVSHEYTGHQPEAYSGYNAGKVYEQMQKQNS